MSLHRNKQYDRMCSLVSRILCESQRREHGPNRHAYGSILPKMQRGCDLLDANFVDGKLITHKYPLITAVTLIGQRR